MFLFSSSSIIIHIRTIHVITNLFMQNDFCVLYVIMAIIWEKIDRKVCHECSHCLFAQKVFVKGNRMTVLTSHLQQFWWISSFPQENLLEIFFCRLAWNDNSDIAKNNPDLLSWTIAKRRLERDHKFCLMFKKIFLFQKNPKNRR